MKELIDHRRLQLLIDSEINQHSNLTIPISSVSGINIYNGHHHFGVRRRNSDPSSLVSFTNPHSNLLSRMLINYIEPLLIKRIFNNQTILINSNIINTYEQENKLNNNGLQVNNTDTVESESTTATATATAATSVSIPITDFNNDYLDTDLDINDYSDYDDNEDYYDDGLDDGDYY